MVDVCLQVSREVSQIDRLLCLVVLLICSLCLFRRILDGLHNQWPNQLQMLSSKVVQHLSHVLAEAIFKSSRLGSPLFKNTINLLVSLVFCNFIFIRQLLNLAQEVFVHDIKVVPLLFTAGVLADIVIKTKLVVIINQSIIKMR
jgi:hypothetical protein